MKSKFDPPNQKTFTKTRGFFFWSSVQILFMDWPDRKRLSQGNAAQVSYVLIQFHMLQYQFPKIEFPVRNKWQLSFFLATLCVMYKKTLANYLHWVNLALEGVSKYICNLLLFFFRLHIHTKWTKLESVRLTDCYMHTPCIRIHSIIICIFFFTLLHCSFWYFEFMSGIFILPF